MTSNARKTAIASSDFTELVRTLKLWVLLTLLLCARSIAFAEEPERGRIGLTLSGGGAKGFAHIGVLHVIDSLNLKVNYITGTSMGSIVGGLYSAGYSAAEIEEIALSIDWANVFGPTPVLENVHVRNRYQAGKSLIELPFNKNSIVVGTGAIEGQQLWSILERLFFHLRETKNFEEFPTPFACVATNIETGEPVIMSSGDIISALRASSAIPAVFTSVQREGKHLLDGGAVNNFPVNVVKEMGAEYTIGVNVSYGLRKAEELNTPIDIIYQLGLFKNATLFEQNKQKTDLYIYPDLEGFDASDFTDVVDIIERGKQMARNFIPELKELARINPKDTLSELKVKREQSIVVDHVSFQGLNKIRENFLNSIVEAYIKDSTNAEGMSLLIKRLYATGYFERITYTFEPSKTDPHKKHVIFSFIEKPMNSLRMGLNYTDFMGVGLTGGITTKKLFLNNLYGDFSFSLGSQPAYRAKIDFFTSEYLKNWMSLKAEGNVLEFPYNENFTAVAAYRKRHTELGISFNQIAGKSAYLFAGVLYNLQNLNPTIQTDFALDGRYLANKIFAGLRKYSLDRHAFTRSGINLSVESSWVFNQKTSFIIVGEDENVNNLSQTNISINNFLQLQFLYEFYHPIHSNSSFFMRFQAGYNHNYTQGFLNMFNLGGTSPFLRDQILFPGIEEYGILTPAAITTEMGWNINLWSDFFLIPILGAGVYDFDAEQINTTDIDNLLLGSGLTLGYLSPLGPIKATLSYSPQKSRVLGYINFGWDF